MLCEESLRSEEVLEGYLKRVCERVEERLVVQSASTRRNASLSTKTSQALGVVESTVRECYGEFSEELLAEYHANVQMMGISYPSLCPASFPAAAYPSGSKLVRQAGN